MRVSVVMAAFNAEATIGAAVRSVVTQTYGDWELLVVDDGSTDRTAHLAAASGDARVTVMREAHVGVLARVRNRALERTTGDVVALLDADDLWRPGKLAAQVEVLLERPDVGVVHTGAELLRGERLERARRAPAGPLLSELVRRNFVYSSSAVVRLELLEAQGGFDPDPALRGSPDYDLWLKLAPETAFAYVDEPLLVYRLHAGQMTADLAEMSRGTLAALRKFAARAPELVPDVEPHYTRSVAIAHCLAGERREGRRGLARVLRRRPWDALAWRWLVRSLLR